MNDKNITVVGAGSWGTAIAVNLTRNDHEVTLYSRRKDQVDGIKKSGYNKDYFPDIKLPDLIKPTSDLTAAVKEADIVFLSVPTSATRKMALKIKDLLKTEAIIVSTAKGIEEDRFLTNSQIIGEICSQSVVVLSGPTHAEEVILNMPTAVVVSSRDIKTAKKVQEIMSNLRFRAYTNPDTLGVELGAAVKNIIALASGISAGLSYGDNAIAALITRGLSEIRRFGAELGARKTTFAGLSGLGDLVVTCTSQHSRNRRFGYKIGQGLSKEEAAKEVGQVVEGIKTTRALIQAKKLGKIEAEMPITEEIYEVLFAEKTPVEAVNELMSRDMKTEIG
ncbi:MAG: NAD(P)H-dependent glycerol-3-phosphate dehydrogenase [Bacillota bacterium]